MAYVPDYIRPVGPKSPPSIPTTPTNSNHVRRTPSVAGSVKSTTSNGRERSNSRRRSSSTPVYTPSRFFKPPQDRLCSRVSIKDRLKCLESEAAVKLELRPTAQRPKRCSMACGSSYPLQVNTSSDKDGQSEDNSSISSVRSNIEPIEKIGEILFAIPKPDIIASNQPKNSTGMQLSSQNNNSVTPETYQQRDSSIIPRTAKGKTIRDMKPVEEHHSENLIIPQQNDVPKLDIVLSDNDEEFSAAKNSFTSHKIENRNTNRRTSEPSTPYCNNKDQVYEKMQPTLVALSSSDVSSADKKPKMKKRTKSSENLGAFDSNAKEKNPSGSGFKPIWRTPSFKQAEKTKKDRLSSYVDDNETSEKVTDKPISTEPQEKKASSPAPEVSPSLDEAQEPSGATQNSTKTKTTSSEEKEGSKSVTESATIAANSSTTQAVAANATSYPVELRSPRHEHSGQAFRHQGARDKRNARVFIMPSSSDSDLDNNNQLTRMERDFAKLGFTRAVDLLPDSYKVALSEYNSNQTQKTSDLTIRHVTPVKFVPNVLKANIKDAKDEKKDTTHDQSLKIYPELLTPSGRSRRDSKTRDGDSKKDSQKSPNRRRRSMRSSRSGANRSKSTDARRAGHDPQRNRSNSMCDPNGMRRGQEAVANAVISGHHPSSAIPYIDDVSSPVEEGITNNQHPKARRMSATTDRRAGDIGTIHRSNSADVLSSVVPKVLPAKLRRARASSVDRSAARGVHRRSYQIATMAKDSDPEHQKNVEKLKKFLLDADCNGDGSRESSFGDQDMMTRSGCLHFKVATIDKGKRTSSQKSWRIVWANLKDQQLCLTKDLTKSKNIQDSPIERKMSGQDEVQSLNVQSSLVGIAYNYLKRRNVFKLTTFNGSEYLFQADNRNDMLAWIDAIQKQSTIWEDGIEGISEDLILRKTSQLESGPKSDKRSARKRSPKPNQKNNLQVKDVDGSRRFKWRGSVNKIVKKFGTGQPFALNGTFGVHLEDCPPSLANEFVPFIVELCCRIVEERGLHFTGIYRVPGNNAALSALQVDLNNRGAESIQPDDERLRELNVVSSLMKSFFRKLPEPLFTNELYHDFIHANREQTPDGRLNGLRKLVHTLPGPHYETLKFLISHLRLVADNCDSNKMEVRNLAIVFGPTLVRNTAADNTATMVTDMSDQCRIIESIIEHAEWFFSDICDPAPESSRTAVPAEREHEAVPSIEFLLDNVGRKPGDTGTTESGKSKGSDDSENSFSRDLMDLLFGKKWKQSTNGNNRAAVGDGDDGGFAEYHSKNQDGAVAKKKEAVPEVIVSESAKVPQTTLQPAMPNVSERLMNFYREHLERLSQTAIGQTLPTFSSADSSPRTTPRHSTVFNAPLSFPSQDNTPRVGNRSRVSSDSRDPKYISSSYEVSPKLPPHSVPLPEVISRTSGAPLYKQPPNPYRPNVDSYNPKPSVLEVPCVPLPVITHSKPNVIPEVHKAKTSTCDSPNSIERHNSPKSSSQKPSRSDNLPYANDHPQIEPIVATKAMTVDTIIDENHPPISVSERLVGELAKPLYTTSPSSTRSRKLSSTSPDPSASKPFARTHSKKASSGLSTQKRRKIPLKENFSLPVITSTATSDKLFSRYDPKRRGIRFAGSENDQLSFLQNPNMSPKKQQLTATERLFNGQPMRRKPSTRENRSNKIIRRHTLSGMQDLEEHSPSLKSKSNLQQAAIVQNLSMYDLATVSANGQRSAMERLNPKGATSGMTLGNWMVQERLRNKTVQGNGSTGSSARRHKDVKGQFHSYV